MPNASNTAGVRDALGVGEGADVTDTRAVLAVQGPAARERLATVFPEAAEVARFHVARLRWEGTDVVVAGTGYTGENGVEIAVPAAEAHRLWEAVLAAGVEPAGLGARDTLRLEAGLPLHGHELGPGITPLQAGLGWVVAWDKGEFRGRKPLAVERERGVERKLRGLEVEGRRPPRADQTVMSAGEAIGRVTSGNYSPTLDRGIALAFLPPDVGEERDVAIDVRGTEVPARVVALPFYKRERK
jgi:aminomethyltransferase